MHGNIKKEQKENKFALIGVANICDEVPKADSVLRSWCEVIILVIIFHFIPGKAFEDKTCNKYSNENLKLLTLVFGPIQKQTTCDESDKNGGLSKLTSNREKFKSEF